MSHQTELERLKAEADAAYAVWEAARLVAREAEWAAVKAAWAVDAAWEAERKAARKAAGK